MGPFIEWYTPAGYCEIEVTTAEDAELRWLANGALSVVSRPDPHIVGHVVIPELNATDYAANKGKFTAWKLAIATQSSEAENIVRWPRDGQIESS